MIEALVIIASMAVTAAVLNSIIPGVFYGKLAIEPGSKCEHDFGWGPCGRDAVCRIGNSNYCQECADVCFG